MLDGSKLHFDIDLVNNTPLAYYLDENMTKFTCLLKELPNGVPEIQVYILNNEKHLHELLGSIEPLIEKKKGEYELIYIIPKEFTS